MKHRNWFFGFSSVLIVLSIIGLAVFGLRPSIDFTGGTVMELEIENPENIPSEEELQASVTDLFTIDEYRILEGKFIQISGSQIDGSVKLLLENTWEESIPEVSVVGFSTVGPSFGQEVLRKMLVAVALVAVGITLYIWRQFKELKYGVCAVIAMFHDSLILLGAFAFFGVWLGIEVDVLFVTAVLTTLSFSVHDTIVVFDRIRELTNKYRKEEYQVLVNTAVLETLSRSINNSVTIILVLLALSLLGGITIRWFAVALLIGAVVGTYSSTFLAAPLLLAWEDVKAWRKGNSR